MILMTVIVLIVYGCLNWSKAGGPNQNVYALNPDTYTAAIGFSVYAFEGIGLILPVQDITQNP